MTVADSTLRIPLQDSRNPQKSAQGSINYPITVGGKIKKVQFGSMGGRGGGGGGTLLGTREYTLMGIAAIPGL